MGQNKGELIRENGELYFDYKGSRALVNPAVITIKLKEGVKELDNSLKPIRSNELGYVDLLVPEDTDVESYYKKLNDSGEYELVKYALFGELYSIPNDLYINNQWYLDYINAYDTWNLLTTGDSIIKVAVLDLEIDQSHEDIGIGTDNYSNINSALGYNYTYNTQAPVNPADHGTFVAGIIGAKTNNSTGIAGITGGNNCSGVKIIPLCVSLLGSNYYIDMSVVDDAILYAKNNGAKVINMSFGGPNSLFPDIDDAIDLAYNSGVSLVAAIGNDGTITNNYPACNPKVIAVGAIDKSYHRCSFSTYGPVIDIVAPGDSIYSTMPNNTYAYDSGTSYSAPQVSGTIALMLSVNPNLSPLDIKYILQSTCTKLSSYSYTSGWNNEVGYGLLNTYDAVLSSKWELLGSSYLLGTNTYSVSNLPSGYSVSWTFTPNGITPSGFSFQANSPQTGQCTTIYTNRAQDFSGTLCASIYRDTTLVTTFTKNLSYVFPHSLIGTFSQVDGFNSNHIWDIPTTSFYDEDEILCNIKSTITLNSPLFACYNTTYSGANLTNWYDNGNGTITLMFRYSANSLQHLTVTGRDYNTNNLIYQFYLTALPANGGLILNHLNMNVVGETLNIYLENMDDNDRLIPNVSDDITDNNEQLYITITNSLTGQTMFRSCLQEVKAEVSTSGWPKGVYIVKGEMGNSSVVRKISIR